VVVEFNNSTARRTAVVQGGGWQLDLSGRCPQKHATVVVLTLDGPPKEPEKPDVVAGEEDG